VEDKDDFVAIRNNVDDGHSEIDRVCEPEDSFVGKVL